MEEDTDKKKMSPKILWGIVAGVVALLAIGVVVSKINANHRAQTLKAARATRLREALKRKAEEVQKQEQAAWEKTKRQVASIRNAKRYGDAVKQLQKFIDAYPGSEFAAAAKTELNNIQGKIDAQAEEKEQRIASVVDGLKSKSEEFLQKGEFEKAVDVYKSYSGEFADETATTRRKLATECADQILQLKDEAKQREQDAQNALLDSISEQLVAGKFRSALTKFEQARKASPDPANEIFSDSVAKSLRQLASVNKIILGAYKRVLNKKTTIRLKGGKRLAGTLVKVTDKGKLYVKVPKGKQGSLVKAVDISELSGAEKYIRASKNMEPTAAAIYLVACAVAGKKFNIAEGKVEDTGVFAPTISRIVAEMSEQQNVFQSDTSIGGGTTIPVSKPNKEAGPPPLIPPVMAAHRLYWFAAGLRVRDLLGGKTVTVTGMVEHISGDSKGLKIEMYNGKVICHADFMNTLPLRQFYDNGKKTKHNKRGDYKDFLIKATLQGVVKPATAGAVNIENATLVNWYGVDIISNGASLRFTVQNQPAGDSITAYEQPYTNESIDLTGFINTAQIQGAKFILRIDNKWALTMGNDPLSLATEARKIYNIMCKKGFRSAMRLKIKAEDENAKMRLLRNAKIIDWEATGGAVSLYSVQNYIGSTVPLTQDNALK